jgi:hypothetical protein
MKNLHAIRESHLSRPQSPAVEEMMREQIHDTIKTLLEGSYLYQNKTIDISAILKKADSQFPTARLQKEFTYRPWIPFSQNRGFTSNEREIMTTGNVGGSPLHSADHEMRLTFTLPTISTECPFCGEPQLHDSIPHVEASAYHLNQEAIKEAPGFKTYLFNYQCLKCKSAPITYMVRRELLKVQLCGRSSPYFPAVPKEIPRALRNIYKDAVSAIACADISGAFYHLRTLMEIHMKSVCQIPIDEQIDGAALCQRYNKTLDAVVSQRASLTAAFDQSAANLHTRKGTREQFESALKLIEGHFRLAEQLKALPLP